MNYRDLGNTGLKVSEIGMGCEGFAEDHCRNAKVLFDLAEENGINYFDLYTSNPISVLSGKTDNINEAGISQK